MLGPGVVVRVTAAGSAAVAVIAITAEVIAVKILLEKPPTGDWQRPLCE